MIYFDGIEINEKIDVIKDKDSIECMVCHYWHFDNEFKFQKSVYNDCHEMLMISLEIENTAITTVKRIDCSYVI